MEHPHQFAIKVDGSRAAAVDAYVEYRRIVGDDDNGQMMSPEEFEAYKKRVIPLRMKNRLFTAYASPDGMDCKLVGPETPCFCGHRYKQHKTDYETIPPERPIPLPCRAAGCPCDTYHYVPTNGGAPIRCTCKHFPEDHSPKKPYKCKSGGCTKCNGFRSSFTCACGNGHMDHIMIVETAEEREKRGHPVGQFTPYAAMGGITGFSSLAEGYMRLDQSGRGAPNEEWLNQPITAMDHPFLRSNVESVKAHQRATGKPVEQGLTETKLPGESDMDFYERRYQERLRLENSSKYPAMGTLRQGVRQNPAIQGSKPSGSTAGPSSSKGGPSKGLGSSSGKSLIYKPKK